MLPNVPDYKSTHLYPIKLHSDFDKPLISPVIKFYNLSA